MKNLAAIRQQFTTLNDPLAASSVHGRFKPWHVDQIRKDYPEMKVLVHPECPREVVEGSDLDGSTSFIIKTVENSPSGAQWAIGTEVNLVNRLQQRFPDKLIRLLAPDLCMCARCTESRSDLAWAMDNLRAAIRKRDRGGRRDEHFANMPRTDERTYRN